VGYFIITLQQIPAKSVGERNLKIGQYLAKLEAKIEWHFFAGHGVCAITCRPETQVLQMYKNRKITQKPLSYAYQMCHKMDE